RPANRLHRRVAPARVFGAVPRGKTNQIDPVSNRCSEPFRSGVIPQAPDWEIAGPHRPAAGADRSAPAIRCHRSAIMSQICFAIDEIDHYLEVPCGEPARLRTNPSTRLPDSNASDFPDRHGFWGVSTSMLT